MALGNDNFYGYGIQAMTQYKVRWIEAAAACPSWNTMMVFYMEEDEGHLMEDEVFRAAHRTAVRGNLWSVQKAVGGHHQEPAAGEELSLIHI